MAYGKLEYSTNINDVAKEVEKGFNQMSQAQRKLEKKIMYAGGVDEYLKSVGAAEQERYRKATEISKKITDFKIKELKGYLSEEEKQTMQSYQRSISQFKRYMSDKTKGAFDLFSTQDMQRFGAEFSKIIDTNKSKIKSLTDEYVALSKKLGKGNYTLQEGITSLDKMDRIKAAIEEITKKYPQLGAAAEEAWKYIDNSKRYQDTINQEKQLRKNIEDTVAVIEQYSKKLAGLGQDKGNEKNFYEDEIKKKKAELEALLNQPMGSLETEDYKTKIRDTISLINEEVVTIQKLNQAKNTDKQNKLVEKQAQAEINQKEKEYLQLLQQKFNFENKIAQLSRDKSTTAKNQNLINEYKNQINLIQEKIKKVQEEYNIESRIPQKIKDATEAHRNEQAVIAAKNKDLNESNGLLSDTLKNFMKFTVYYTSLNYLKQGIQQAIETMKDLDKAFTDIQLVTQGTDAETAQLAKDYNELAKEMGSTTVEVANGAGEWLRQGKTAEETAQLLKASMTLSKVGAIESSQATQLLTSSLNGYKLEAKDAMSVVDKISEIDLKAATSSEELATALARTANIANDSEVSFDKLLAMIGTVSSVTRRSAETIRRII